GAKAAADAPEQLRTLDRRIKRVHDARGWALVAVVVTVLGLLALGGAPGVLGCASAVAASLTLSAGGVEAFWALVFGLAGLTAALAVLALRLRREPVTARRLALAGVGVVLLTFALVGIDAALGGSSHVTHAVGTGPGSLLGDLGRRLHLSYLSVTDSWAKGLEFAAGVAALVAIAAFFRRGPAVDAMLVALAVSFLVNNTPVDVAFLGALGCWTLVRWEAVDSRAMRRTGPVVLFASSLLVLALAGCGSEGTVKPLPQTVVGTVKQEAPGKGV